MGECRRAILAKKPKYIVFENVKALVSQKFLPYFLKWQHELESYGYSNFAKVLNSRDYGVPQNRERIFMISVLDENASYHFPAPFPLERRLADVLEVDVDEKYFLSEKLVNYVFSKGGKDGNIQGGINVHTVDDEAVGALTANYYKSPRQGNYIKELVSGDGINVVGNRFASGHSGDRVYGVGGIAPTVMHNSVAITEPQVLTMRRTEHGKQVRREGGKEVFADKAFEPRNDGICNTLSSVLKDNLIIEPFNPYEDGTCRTLKAQYYKNGMANFKRSDGLGATGVKVISNMYGNNNKGGKHEISPTITSNSWECNNILIESKILSYTRDANGKVVDRHCKDIANTIHGGTGGGGNTDSYVIENDCRIRKLTERECFRLMDVDDSDIDKIQAAGISRSRQYALAGNSITINVLYHIFRKLFIDKGNESRELTLF